MKQNVTLDKQSGDNLAELNAAIACRDYDHVWPITVKYYSASSHRNARLSVKCDRLRTSKVFEADNFSTNNREWEAVILFLQQTLGDILFCQLKASMLGRLNKTYPSGDIAEFFITDDVFELGREMGLDV